MRDPVLRTERLVLRPPTPASARALLAGSPDGPDGFPSDDDRVALTGFVAAGEDARGTWVVERDGAPLGTVSDAGPVSPSGDQEVTYAPVPSAPG